MIALSAQIQNYLYYCENQKNLNPHTIKAYRIDLDQFAKYFTLNNLNLEKSCLRGYI